MSSAFSFQESDPSSLRSVCLQTVALRRHIPNNDSASCWIDCYGSTDHGRTWQFLSKVGQTGGRNGNPPALSASTSGRLVCIYGDRTRASMIARLSNDGGVSWSEETVLREDYQPDRFGDMDFGYPQLVLNHEANWWPHIAGLPGTIHNNTSR